MAVKVGSPNIYVETVGTSLRRASARRLRTGTIQGASEKTVYWV
jgi:hypothetical protein